MNLDYKTVHQTLIKHVRQPSSISQAMSEVIDVCQKSVPHKDWERLRDLPYDDIYLLNEWFNGLLKSDPISEDIRGLWFGLFNPIYDDEPSSDMYFSGSVEYDESDEDFEWACTVEYLPEGRYARSSILNDIYQIAYSSEHGLKNNAEWTLALSYATLAVKHLLTTVDPELIVRHKHDIGIAVGFDSGDAVQLGTMRMDGFSLHQH